MQRLLFSSTFLLIFFFACKSETEQPSVQKTTGCQPGKDTINLLTTFKKDTDKTPTDRFYSIVSFITNKGFFKPQVQKNGKLMIEVSFLPQGRIRKMMHVPGYTSRNGSSQIILTVIVQ